MTDEQMFPPAVSCMALFPILFGPARVWLGYTFHTAPPGPFPSWMVLAASAAITGGVLTVLGVKELSDASLRGVLPERPSIVLDISIGYVNLAVFTSLAVLGCALYAHVYSCMDHVLTHSGCRSGGG